MRPCSWAHLEPVWSRRVLRWASSNELHCGQYGASVDCFVLFHCDSQQVVVLTPLAKQIKEWDTNIQAGVQARAFPPVGHGLQPDGVVVCMRENN